MEFFNNPEKENELNQKKRKGPSRIDASKLSRHISVIIEIEQKPIPGSVTT